ncbi:MULTISPECIES: hypothetical protein [Calothrix]|uniref:Uncharacterized protein n=2 Tax=Calothrix TaxID=1186 RepID=A0ABR8ADN6_9CYAN|nr:MULTISPECIES: hypothetical protein [Calothrix]MBD2197453.1 hypothetical protein [Calothrix parietina FACHB-288]MBD2226020.1 hypothetical protein [Calothrix anomala FACHB-343]
MLLYPLRSLATIEISYIQVQYWQFRHVLSSSLSLITRLSQRYFPVCKWALGIGHWAKVK